MHAGQFATLEQVLDHYNMAPAAPQGHSELEPLPEGSRQRADRAVPQRAQRIGERRAALARRPEVALAGKHQHGDTVRHGRKRGQDGIAVTPIKDEAGSVKEPVDLPTRARTKVTSNAFLKTAMGYPMNIGEAAQVAGVTAKMIRNYGGLGLIPEATRTDAGYRQYAERDVTVLRFIRQSRSMGFSIKQIEQLLGPWADANRQSRDVKDLAREHIAEHDRKMAEMAQTKASLERIAAGCQGDERADCPILSRLSGDTAARPLAAPPPKVPKEASRKAERTETRQTECPQHAGLSTWMQGLRQVSAAEHA